MTDRILGRPSHIAVTLAATVGLVSTCILPDEPTEQRIEFEIPAETVLVAIADSVAPQIVVLADGNPFADAQVQLESGDPRIVAVEGSGGLRGVGRGLTAIQIRLLSSATAKDVPDTTFDVQGIIYAMTLARPVDSITALGDTLFFRPGYLDATDAHLPEADSAAMNPTFELRSAAGAVVLDSLSGAIVAIANGTDTVRAHVDTSAVDLVVTVHQRAESLAVNADPSPFRSLGETRQLTVSAWDSRANPVAAPTVSWICRDTLVATIDTAGVVTAVANGTATIVATADDVSDSVTVTVQQVVDSLAVQPESTTVTVGDTTRLVAVALDANRNTVVDSTITWASSNDVFATVDASGLVTGVDTGVVSITATAASGVSDTAIAVVQFRADSLDVTPDNVLFTALGQTQQLTAQAFRANGDLISGKSVSWATSDPSVAAVDATGLVSAIDNGPPGSSPPPTTHPTPPS